MASRLNQRLDDTNAHLKSNLESQETLRREVGEMERLIARETELRMSVVARQNEVRFSLVDTAIRDITQRIDLLKQELYEHVDLLTRQRTEAVSSAVVEHSQRHAEQIVGLLRNDVDALAAAVRRDIDLLRALNSSPSVAADISPRTSSSHEVIDEALYVALEDHFRGEQEVIRDRQRAYLPLIERVESAEAPVLDFGCGRGEWLEVLRNAGIPAKGFDSNRVCVAECTEKNLEVDLGDLFEVLGSLPDRSARAITFFQVFEHLPFSRLQEVLRACLRVLIPGGILIAEIPNSENLTVAASTFWIDPTHGRPLHPQVLKFLAAQTGYRRVDGIYSTPLSAPLESNAKSGPLGVEMERIHQLLFGPGDFALVATA